MPIDLKTPLSSIDAYIDGKMEEAKQTIIDNLCYVGSECINEAKVNGNYNNPSGNLRSSIGYAVVVDGQIYEQAVVEQTGNGTEGRANAEAFLAKLAQEHPTGFWLIVVAGMNYAVYVEGRGKNVLTSAELLAERLLPETMTQLGFTIRKK